MHISFGLPLISAEQEPHFAVPAARQIVRLIGLDAMDGVQHDHPFGHLGRVVPERRLRRVPAPDAKRGRCHEIS
jgi:hypothetical protein